MTNGQAARVRSSDEVAGDRAPVILQTPPLSNELSPAAIDPPWRSVAPVQSVDFIQSRGFVIDLRGSFPVGGGIVRTGETDGLFRCRGWGVGDRDANVSGGWSPQRFRHPMSKPFGKFSSRGLIPGTVTVSTQITELASREIGFWPIGKI